MMQRSKEVQIYIKFNSRKPTCNKKHTVFLVKFLKSHIDTFNRAGNYMDLILCDENNEQAFSQLKHKHGIKRLPALILVGLPNKIYGVDDIKKLILNLCKSNSRSRLSITKSNDELVREHQAQCMRVEKDRNGMPVIDVDEQDDNPYETRFDPGAQATAEWQRRKDQFEEFDGNSARGRRNIRNSRKNNMNHRGPYGEQQDEPMGRRNVFDDNMDYEDYEPRREGNIRGRVKMRDNPADLQRNLPGNMKDNDLMAQFWENNEETQLS